MGDEEGRTLVGMENFGSRMEYMLYTGGSDLCPGQFIEFKLICLLFGKATAGLLKNGHPDPSNEWSSTACWMAIESFGLAISNAATGQYTQQY